MNKILLAYSGGLDTSCILAWLKEKYQVPIIAYCANVGQNEDFDEVSKKALNTGADHCIIDDLKETFVSQYVFPSIKANAVYEGTYLLGTSLARPCIAKGMVEAALAYGCDAIAHGATGKGNDQVRFELAIKALAPQLKVIAPWREWEFQGRADLFHYAQTKNIPLPITLDKPYSIDANIMHISYEGGILEDPWTEAPEDIFVWTQSPLKAPDQAEYLTIEFTKGIPTAINGQTLAAVKLLQEANALAAKHGVGRVDLVENRYIGIKSRGVYETPGVTMLLQAHKALESLCLDREVTHLKETFSLNFAKLTYSGYWFSPEAELVRAFMEGTQNSVTGMVKLKLFKGSSQVVARKSEFSLYDSHLSSFENMSSFNTSDSAGFININGLRLSKWNQQKGEAALASANKALECAK